MKKAVAMVFVMFLLFSVARTQLGVHIQTLDDLIIDAISVEKCGNLSYNLVKIINGGELRVRGYDGTVGTGWVNITANTMIVDSTSKINADFRGYRGVDGNVGNEQFGYQGECYRINQTRGRGANYGGGGGGFSNPSGGAGGGGGAGFGGPGGEGGWGYEHGYPPSYGGIGGNTYGSTYDINTLTLGSAGGQGGGWGAGGKGGNGGGFIRLNSPKISISGTISADGENGAPGASDNYNGGGGSGSGGYILINGINVTLAGTLSVQGGNGGSHSSYSSRTAGGGGGGGGRIKIFYKSLDNSSLIVKLSGGSPGANGGDTVSAPTSGSSGTIEYFSQSSLGEYFDRYLLERSIDMMYGIKNFERATIKDSATLYVYRYDATLIDSGILTLKAIHDITIDSSSKIDGDGKGYREGKGGFSQAWQGESYTGTPTQSTSNNYGGGGGGRDSTSGGGGGGGGGAYGGTGGRGGRGAVRCTIAPPGEPGQPYSRADNRAYFLGSGGGGGGRYGYSGTAGDGGRGGGVIILNSSRILIQGQVLASGENGYATFYREGQCSGGGGGGSGGTILLYGDRINISRSSIIANGGNGGNVYGDNARGGGGGGGSGGRVKIFYSLLLDNSSASVTVYGGVGGSVINPDYTCPGENGNNGNNGTIYYEKIRPLHDIAIVSVTPSATQVYAGEVLSIAVVVKNEGTQTETCNVTAYYDETVIETQQVSNLSPDNEATLSFSWDTTGVTDGINYTIRAEASVIPGEIDIADNTFIDGAVRVTMVKIMETISCDQTGHPKDAFKKGTIAYFKVTVNNTCLGPENVLLTVNIYDSDGATIGVGSFQGPITPGVSIFILGLPIPTYAHVGIAAVYANAFSDWPHKGGVPYCPEMSATFEIIAEV